MVGIVGGRLASEGPHARLPLIEKDFSRVALKAHHKIHRERVRRVKAIVDSGPPKRPKRLHGYGVPKHVLRRIARENEKIVRSMMYIMRHPGPTDCTEPKRPHRSMNISVRRKNHRRIQYENALLREKLTNMRSVIPNRTDLKKRWKEQRHYRLHLSKLPLEMNFNHVDTSHGFRNNPEAYLPPPDRLMRPNLCMVGSPRSYKKKMRRERMRKSKSAGNMGFGSLEYRLRKEMLSENMRPSTTNPASRSRKQFGHRPASRLAQRPSTSEARSRPRRDLLPPMLQTQDSVDTGAAQRSGPLTPTNDMQPLVEEPLMKASRSGQDTGSARMTGRSGGDTARSASSVKKQIVRRDISTPKSGRRTTEQDLKRAVDRTTADMM